MRVNKLNNVKESRGITLIALVITIIVLIILATVSISMVISKDGIIARAEKAKDYYANAEADDIIKTATLTNMIATEMNGGGSSDTGLKAGDEITDETQLPDWEKKDDGSKDDTNRVTPISDGMGGVVPLPDEFYYIGGNRELGLVISDVQGDSMDAEGPSSGNQFVWIPVDNPVDFFRSNFTSTGMPGSYSGSGVDAGNCDELETSEYSDMKWKVEKYKGFYIGRYEAGEDRPYYFRGDVTDAQPVVCKKGVVPYNWVPWGTDFEDIGGEESPSGAAYLATKMYQDSDSVVSTLCYGIQWDAMCRYLGSECANTIGIKTGVQVTGSEPNDIVRNIYDLAGNCLEWTMEAKGGSYHIYRGGCYDEGYPIYNRWENYPWIYADSYAFRPALYIKN